MTTGHLPRGVPTLSGRAGLGNDIWRDSATDLAAAYRSGTRSPLQVVAVCFNRIASIDKVLNAFVALRVDAAMEEARASTERFARGACLGPLDGVPIAVKDNIPVAGFPTTWGSFAGRASIPSCDEMAVARLRAQGAIVVGKTNVPEFTLEGYTSNALFGPTRNPWNPLLTPGGSSGGSVAAVAAGLVPLALGTDGGGSIRRPASHTGLVGFKPSIGSIARLDALPPLLLDFEVIGPIARSVCDARMLFDAMAGPMQGDRRSLAAQAAQMSANPFPRQLRVLYVPRFGDAPVDPEITASCARAVNRIAALGHDVREGTLGVAIDAIIERWPLIGRIGLAWLFERHRQWAHGASEAFLEMAREGAAVPARDLWGTLEIVEQLRRDCVALFDGVDLVITPSAAALPWPADQTHPAEIDGVAVGPRGHAVFTGWVNAAGLPALALPCEHSSTGMPIGLQLIAGYGCDQALLAAGEALESTLHLTGQWPALPAT